jgi:hypothetical protein
MSDHIAKSPKSPFLSQQRIGSWKNPKDFALHLNYVNIATKNV